MRTTRGRALALTIMLGCGTQGGGDDGATSEAGSTSAATSNATSAGTSSGDAASTGDPPTGGASSESTGSPPDMPPARACNGQAALCERRYDEVVFPCTHNAFAAREAGFQAINANQNHTVAQQLVDGVRCMMLDVSEDKDESVLCHGPCSFGRLDHAELLLEIADFMTANPDEVLTILYQDDIAVARIVADLEAAGLVAMTYAHPPGDPWPTLAEMIDAGTRLVITAEAGGPPPAWYQHLWDLAWDTPYTWYAAEEFDCSLNRGQMGNDLFLINHWLSTEFDTPSEAGAESVNAYDVLHARAKACEAEVGRLPNFLAVDFYDHGELFAVVDALNGV
ncbi:MAG: hypothetical protein JNL82_14755 [Myxococcales bacterium]|nr:hypothetical protein [Myxococcales bacterium]